MKLKILKKETLFSDSNHIKLLGTSNAFPDYIRFRKKEYLCFRTAPFHFPTKKSQIIIFSNNNKIWQLEKILKIENHDVRNPKFFIHKKKLFIIFSGCHNYNQLNGKNFFYMAFKEKGGWSIPKKLVYPQGLTPFRVKKVYNYQILSAFNDFSGLKDVFIKPKTYFFKLNKSGLWEKTDILGLNNFPGWETDFLNLGKKTIFISRLDFSFDKKHGSLLVLKDQKKIRKKTFLIKIDAPFLFQYKSKVFLAGRRSLFFKGRYDIAPKILPEKIRTIFNLIIYWLTPKSLFLWSINLKRMALNELGAFPTAGDNGYAVVVKKEKKSFFELITYTNHSKFKHSLPWCLGQLMKTKIVKFSFIIKG